MKIIIHDSNERNGSRKISNQIYKTMGKKETGQHGGQGGVQGIGWFVGIDFMGKKGGEVVVQ